MNKKRENATGMNRIAQAQSIGGQVGIIGQGMVPSNDEAGFDPYRILDDAPVFFSGYNIEPSDGPLFKANKTHKWGEYYDPELMPGMPSIGGRNKLYVDTRIKGFYILWCSTKMDESAIGPSDWWTRVIAWTPKTKYDSLVRAGYRMFWAAALNVDMVERNDFYCPFYDDDDWNKEWSGTIRCLQVFASIRNTRYENEKAYEKVLKSAPDFLKDHIISRRIIISNVD